MLACSHSILGRAAPVLSTSQLILKVVLIFVSRRGEIFFALFFFDRGGASLFKLSQRHKSRKKTPPSLQRPDVSLYVKFVFNK
jgi:hypothetical protein